MRTIWLWPIAAVLLAGAGVRAQQGYSTWGRQPAGQMPRSTWATSSSGPENGSPLTVSPAPVPGAGGPMVIPGPPGTPAAPAATPGTGATAGPVVPASAPVDGDGDCGCGHGWCARLWAWATY